MKKRNLLLLVLLHCLSCKNKTQQNSQEKFDKTKWAAKQDKNYPYRDKVLMDLITNVKLKGLKKESVLNLLGPPNRTDSNYLFYTVAVDYFAEIPVPLHTKTLVIKFNNDTVEWRKIHE